MARQLEAAGIAMIRQHKPIPGRRYRLDFAIPERQIAIEVDGMVHRIKARFAGDISRHNALTLAGWRWIRAGRDDIRSGEAIRVLRTLLG